MQAALREMVQATWDAMQKDEDGPAKYEPSEKHGEHGVPLPAPERRHGRVRSGAAQAANLDIDATALADPSDVFCYFVRLTDKKKRRLTALRRATQFKGVLKKRLIRFVSDSLKLIDDTVFKLDSDFDLLVDSANVHILRPSGFEFAGKLQQAILDAVPENIEAIRKDLAFVEFDGIEAYAGKHPRRPVPRLDPGAEGDQEHRQGLAEEPLQAHWRRDHRVEGQAHRCVGHEMGFLEVLDRRRYEVELVKESSPSGTGPRADGSSLGEAGARGCQDCHG